MTPEEEYLAMKKSLKAVNTLAKQVHAQEKLAKAQAIIVANSIVPVRAPQNAVLAPPLYSAEMRDADIRLAQLNYVQNYTQIRREQESIRLKDAEDLLAEAQADVVPGTAYEEEQYAQDLEQEQRNRDLADLTDFLGFEQELYDMDEAAAEAIVVRGSAEPAIDLNSIVPSSSGEAAAAAGDNPFVGGTAANRPELIQLYQGVRGDPEELVLVNRAYVSQRRRVDPSEFRIDPRNLDESITIITNAEFLKLVRDEVFQSRAYKTIPYLRSSFWKEHKREGLRVFTLPQEFDPEVDRTSTFEKKVQPIKKSRIGQRIHDLRRGISAPVIEKAAAKQDTSEPDSPEYLAFIEEQRKRNPELYRTGDNQPVHAMTEQEAAARLAHPEFFTAVPAEVAAPIVDEPKFSSSGGVGFVRKGAAKVVKGQVGFRKTSDNRVKASEVLPRGGGGGPIGAGLYDDLVMPAATTATLAQLFPGRVTLANILKDSRPKKAVVAEQIALLNPTGVEVAPAIEQVGGAPPPPPMNRDLTTARRSATVVTAIDSDEELLEVAESRKRSREGAAALELLGLPTNKPPPPPKPPKPAKYAKNNIE
jgi:hypothetical protein